MLGNYALSDRMPTSENPEQEWEDLEKQFNRLEVFYSAEKLQKISLNNLAYVKVQSLYTYVLQDVHKEYCKKVDDVKVIQKQVMESINHQRYCLKQLQDVLKRSEKGASEAETKRLREINQQIAKRKNQFREMEDVLPHNNGWVMLILDIFYYPSYVVSIN